MKKSFIQILEKHYKLDGLIGYIFISLIVVGLLTALPGLPSVIYSTGRIVKTILGVLLLLGIAFALFCGIVQIAIDKKAR